MTTIKVLRQMLKHPVQGVTAVNFRNQLYWLVRSAYVTRQHEDGFILPTVTMLLLMVSLVIGLLVSRTYSRTAQVIGDRQQTALYNAATPAIDRAKAKLEYVFEQAGLSALPSDNDLEQELLKDRYDLPDQSNAEAEERIDVDGDGTLDNAWIYETDVDGNGTLETVAYSILSNASNNDVDIDGDGAADTVEIEDPDADKAKAQVVRNGPINLDASTKCPNTQGTPVAGWESTTDSSQLRKALQVHAIVFDDSSNNSVSATLEMQQDRQAELGNKWGAWFRYDIVGSPFARFNFNGAMHTEGSIALAPFDNTSPGSFLYLVSSPNSCIYNVAASEVSVGSRNQDDDGFDFQGQVLQVDYRDDSEIAKGLSVDRYVAKPNTLSTLTTDASTAGPTADRILLSADTDSGNTRKDSVVDGTKFSDVALNPIVLFTQGISEALGTDATNTTRRTTTTEWDEQVSARSVGEGEFGRIWSNDSSLPFLDDTYRADNRGGPKPVYNDNFKIPDSVTLGATLTDSALIENDPLAINPTDEGGYGLDGYWERRARRSGIRIIVGQRLELGNINKWSTSDPLYPPENAYASSNMADRAHEMRQAKTLRDNLAAVQSAAVYHYKANNKDYPVTCLALTAHPGTQVTDQRSRTFNTATVNETVIKVDVNGNGNQTDTAVPITWSDFYGLSQISEQTDRNGNGRLDVAGSGTNGLEFSPPFAGDATTFAQAIDTHFDGGSGRTPLGTALENLAYFAGDPYGAFPPAQDSNDGNNANDKQASVGPVVHPYPFLSMWGNFSELRRVLSILDQGNTSASSYENLSIADKTILHTATCTLGMLAYSYTNAEANFKQKIVSSTSTISLSTSLAGSKGALRSFAVEADKMLDNNSANGDLSQVIEALPGQETDWDCNGKITPATIGKSGKTTYTTTQVPLPSPYNYASDAASFYTELLNPDSSYYTSRGCTFTATQRDNFAIKRFGASMASQPGGGFYKDDPTGVLTQLAQVSNYINLVSESFQLDRDRTFGFVSGISATTYAPTDPPYEPKSGTGWWDPATNTVPYGTTGTGGIIYPNVGCDPYIFMGGNSPLANVKTSDGSIVDLTLGTTGGAADQSIAFALSICATVSSTTSTPKYPALYYLFPKANHQHNGTKTSTGGRQVLQTTADEYVTQSYIQNVNSGYSYRVVEDLVTGNNSDGDADTGESLSEFVNYLGVTPRNPSTPTNWATPVTSTATGRVNTITYNGTNYDPAFLDMGLYNGRERMNVRTLSIDLDLLRRTKLNNVSGGCTYTTPASDTNDDNGSCWLPLPTLIEAAGGATHTTGLIYAFREDAVREDAIARPTRADASGLTCDADDTVGTKDDEEWAQEWNTYVTNVTDSNSDSKIDILASNGSGLDPFDMVMDAVGLTGYFDPPVDPCTKISPKPVDFYNDPDRRPHGFVLRNGQDLRRSNTAGSTFDTDYRGMSFVSDNPVYVWGNLNLHSSNGTFANRIEEFSTLLTSNWSNFYSRSTLNTNFATGANDTWRQTEIISDAITTLSSNFNPGFIIEGLLWSTELLWSTDASSTVNSYGGMGIPRTIANPTTNTIANLNNSEQADDGGADTDSTADTVIADCANETPASTKRLGRQCWLLEDGTQVGGTTALASVTSPIALNRNGFPLYQANGTTYAYGSSTTRSTEHFEEVGAIAGSGDVYRLTRSRIPRVSATDNMVNAVIVSGISPGRINQKNGGIINFLRFNESWDTDPSNSGTNKDLRFAGSLYQLNFSSYAGGFDQITWEPGEVNANDIGELYYKSPNLNYGYDPALLYVPAGPVARRFTTPGRTRSEFYRELAIDDPYILNLRCAYKADGVTRVDSNVDTTLCSN